MARAAGADDPKREGIATPLLSKLVAALGVGPPAREQGLSGWPSVKLDLGPATPGAATKPTIACWFPPQSVWPVPGHRMAVPRSQGLDGSSIRPVGSEGRPGAFQNLG